MTNGCFDILHAGHVAYLEEAKQRGDRLIVAVNDDASVARLKGPGRPINPLDDRMAVLAGLASVDWVVPFSEDTPETLVGEILPDVLVKGGDYRPENIAGARTVLDNGGTVEVLSFREGRSTIRNRRGRTAAYAEVVLPSCPGPRPTPASRRPHPHPGSGSPTGSSPTWPCPSCCCTSCGAASACPWLPEPDRRALWSWPAPAGPLLHLGPRGVGRRGPGGGAPGTRAAEALSRRAAGAHHHDSHGLRARPGPVWRLRNPQLRALRPCRSRQPLLRLGPAGAGDHHRDRTLAKPLPRVRAASCTPGAGERPGLTSGQRGATAG